MASLTVRSKYTDLSASIKLYYILGIGAFLSILSFALYQSFVVALTMAISTVVVYLVLSRSPEPIRVETVAGGFLVDGDEFSWAECVSFAAVELEAATEIVVETTKIQSRYLYWYVTPSDPDASELLEALSANVPYDELMPTRDTVHLLLRRAGLI